MCNSKLPFHDIMISRLCSCLFVEMRYRTLRSPCVKKPPPPKKTKAPLSKILGSRWSILPRPDPIVPCGSNCVRVPIDTIRRRRRPIGVSSGLRHRAPILRFLQTHELGVGVLLRAPSGRQQIDEEGEDVKGEDEGDDPLEDGRDVLFAVKGGGGEDDGEDDLDDDEGQLQPEGEAQDAVLAEVHAEALVLGADEDGADDVAGDEEEEEAVM